MCAMVFLWRSKGNMWESVLSSTVWVLGIELRLVHQALLPAKPFCWPSSSRFLMHISLTQCLSSSAKCLFGYVRILLYFSHLSEM